MRESIKTEISKEFADIMLEGCINDYNRSFDEMILLNKAYAVMLVDRNIIDKETAATIIEGLDYVHKTFKQNDLNGNLEEFYFNIERAMFAKVGPEIGGRLHCGRSRNDIHATEGRMEIRKTVWDIAKSVAELQELLLEKAAENKDAVMTGYTHWQPGQPNTLGHYYMAIFQALSRDFVRIMHAYKNVNQSPYGAAAAFGTGFDIDRQELAELLGFDSVLENTLDCIASRDYIAELLAAYSLMSVNISRMAEDMYFWSTFENGILEIEGEIAICSSIMPQKRNPCTLEYARGKAGTTIGGLNAALFTLKGVPYTNNMDIFEVASAYFSSIRELKMQITAITQSIKHSKLRRERAVKQAGENLCTVTSLADYWVNKYGISFTDAHDIVGNIVAIILENKTLIAGITPELVKNESKKTLGWEIEMTHEELRSVLDPTLNVESKTGVGGPSKESLTVMIEHGKKTMLSERAWIDETIEHVKSAYAKLEEKIAAISV